MSLLLTIGLLATSAAAQDMACPDDASIRQLKRQNASLQQALTAQRTLAQDLDRAYIQVQTMLGCVPELPSSVIARSFLLLGAYYLDQGDEFRAGPFVAAAAMMGGESAWLEGLSPDLRVRFFNALASDRPRGVVYAPELLLTGEFHLVGSSGPPPWRMPIGTFTFEWNDRSVPINVNTMELTLVTPKTFDEFEALVEGVTESDLEEPDYDAPIYYDRRAERRRQRQEEQRERSSEQPPAHEEGQQTEPDIDAETFFDELTDLETDDSPTPPAPLPEPEVERQGVSVRPHVGLGASYSIMGPATATSPVGDASFGGLGAQAELGLTLRLGRMLALRPEIGFSSAFRGAELDAAQFEDEGYDGAIPVEPMSDRLLLGWGRLPVLLRLGPLSVGAGPSWGIGTARVTTLTSCTDDLSCVAPMQGNMMAAGGDILLGLRPGSSPITAWIDLGTLHDGERPIMAGSLILAWEGSP